MTDRRNNWPLTDDARLTELWAAGMSTSKIGLEMGRTKNAIIGRAHRLNLERRGNPIAREYNQKGAKAPARPRIRKTSTTSLRPSMRSAESLARAVRAERPVCVAPPPIVPRVVASGREQGGCKWPHGDPKAPDFRFCDAPRDASKPYCLEHMAMALAPRREAAA